MKCLSKFLGRYGDCGYAGLELESQYGPGRRAWHDSYRERHSKPCPAPSKLDPERQVILAFLSCSSSCGKQKWIYLLYSAAEEVNYDGIFFLKSTKETKTTFSAELSMSTFQLSLSPSLWKLESPLRCRLLGFSTDPLRQEICGRIPWILRFSPLGPEVGCIISPLEKMWKGIHSLFRIYPLLGAVLGAFI